MNAVQEILVGDSDVVLTGGSDSMSACPYAVRDIRSASFLGSGKGPPDMMSATEGEGGHGVREVA